MRSGWFASLVLFVVVEPPPRRSLLASHIILIGKFLLKWFISVMFCIAFFLFSNVSSCFFVHVHV